MGYKAYRSAQGTEVFYTNGDHHLDGNIAPGASCGCSASALYEIVDEAAYTVPRGTGPRKKGWEVAVIAGASFALAGRCPWHY